MSHTHSGVPADLQYQRSDRVNLRPLQLALAITATFLIVEIVGGLLTGSLALLADAAHMGIDVAALSLSLFAVWVAQRPATAQRSFGYLRAEILAALVNAATLIVVSLYIFWEAAQRITEPTEVRSGLMLVVAAAGLLANGASAWVLVRGGGHQENLNVRGALLHVVGDMLGSVGAILAAVIMLATGWYLADPILSIGIGLLLLWSAWRLLRESVDVLLESSPSGIDMDEVREAIRGIDGVVDVHDLHVWTVTSGFNALSSHVEVSGDRDWSEILLDLAKRLRERFGITHITVQPEEPNRLPESFRGCSIDSPEGLAACRVALQDTTASTGTLLGHGHKHRTG